MSTKYQSPLTLWCQHDLVVGIDQIDLSETMTTTQLLHQILWKWHGMMVRFQLLIYSDRVIPTDPKLAWQRSSWMVKGTTSALQKMGFASGLNLTSSWKSLRHPSSVRGIPDRVACMHSKVLDPPLGHQKWV